MTHNTPKKFGPSIAEHVQMKDVGEIFGYRMMGTMDEYIVKAIEIRLNQFITGVTAGLTRFVEEAAQEAAEQAVAREVEKLVGFKEDSQSVQEAAVTIAAEDTSKEVTEREVLPIIIPDDFVVPRNEKGTVDWAKHDDRGKKRILFFLMKVAESRGVDIKLGKNFKNCGSDFNGAYQRTCPLCGSWKEALEEYKTVIFEKDIKDVSISI